MVSQEVICSRIKNAIIDIQQSTWKDEDAKRRVLLGLDLALALARKPEQEGTDN